VWHLVYEYIGGIRLVCSTLFQLSPCPHVLTLVQMYGPSMMPTLAQEGEVCVEYTLGFQLRGLRSLERGQLITFYSPLDPSRMVVKRLAGLPGDIMCVDPTGQKAPSDQHVVVPANHLWVIGDNAAWSRDSREYGPVPVKLMRGTIVARVWMDSLCFWTANADVRLGQIWPPRSICVFGNSCSPID
jgi:inner membrane protease subunit 1